MNPKVREVQVGQFSTGGVGHFYPDANILAFMDFPKAHRTQIASTNPLERVNAEIKRRTECRRHLSQ